MANRFEQLRLLCAAAETLNFKQAALRLGVAPQAITRAVKELEGVLGEPLFHRSTRQVALTTFGEAFCARARVQLDGMQALLQPEEAGDESGMSGLVRITAPVSVGQLMVWPILRGLMADHPGLQIDLRLIDQHDDAVDARIDLGLRVGAIRDNRFIVRKLRPVRLLVVGAPALLAGRKPPRRIDDLAQWPLTALHDVASGRPWPWFFAEGRQFTPAKPVFTSNDALVEMDAVCGGVGIGQIPDFLIERQLAAGQLVSLLDKAEPAPWDLYLYRPQRGPVPARVRKVFDALSRALAGAAGKRARAGD